MNCQHKIRKIFIASSAELKPERNELVDLLLDLNEKSEIKGQKMKPVLWEFLDSSMGKKRKEDEYLEKLRECETCFVLFWRTLGEYTVEELKVSMMEMEAGRLPKHVFVLFKEPGTDISKELCHYKKSFPDKYPNIPVVSFHNSKEMRNIITNFFKENDIDDISNF